MALYDRLIEIVPSAIYRLNRAIAVGESGDVQSAIEAVDALREERAMQDYYLLDCALARLSEHNGDRAAAIDHYLAALSAKIAPHERALIEKKLKRLGD